MVHHLVSKFTYIQVNTNQTHWKFKLTLINNLTGFKIIYNKLNLLYNLPLY